MTTYYESGFRDLHPGMGQAVAERTILRRKLTDQEIENLRNRDQIPLRLNPNDPHHDKWMTACRYSGVEVIKDEEAPEQGRAPDARWENWGDVADRVAAGNSMLVQHLDEKHSRMEYESMRSHIANASILMSGRHLQHGDREQIDRNLEIFSNCATAPASFLMFYLLLNGSGVGRSYDDDMMIVNWDNAPSLRCVLDTDHPDFDWSAHESVRDAKHKYGSGRDVMWFKVPDSREGWAKALELWEVAAFEKIHHNKMLILDFSDVRSKGSPIGGMQNRPASGPVPLMNAFNKAESIKGSGLEPWRQAMYIDHYFAECVLVGGARRSARMSTKTWRDRNVLEFIKVKRPIEFEGLSMEEVIDLRQDDFYNSFLWSSNNSVTTDQEFWDLLAIKRGEDGHMSEDAQHARRVWRSLTQCSYGDGTGEPGIINMDKLVQNNEGWDDLKRGDYVGFEKYQIDDETQLLLNRLAKRAKKKRYNMITNPCGEIALNMLGGYCVIADVVPFHCDSLEEAVDAFEVSARALLRANLMPSLYQQEVDRTNRIGVGMTGVHEFAWKFFQIGFKDMVSPNFERYYEERGDRPTWDGKDIFGRDHEDESIRSAAFWLMLSVFNQHVNEQAKTYSKKLGKTGPHTTTTIKPAGSTSKLYGLTEGWHLPSMPWFLRWVQFREDDPQIDQYRESGYPVKALKSYNGTVIVGFPTAPTISTLGMGDKMVTAGEATPEDQYKWVMLGEKYWIRGVDAETNEPVGDDRGNQISYTLKYDPDVVEYKKFRDMMHKYQPQVRACSVMPQEDVSSYEYQPEQPMTKAEFEEITYAIQKTLKEDIGMEHVDCGTGGCPIDFDEDEKAEEVA